jgi:hypothetical protein
MVLRDSMKKASEEDWKHLCIKNFDFIEQVFESNKDKNLTAAKLAAESDFNEINWMRETDIDLKQRLDKLAIELRARHQQTESRDLTQITLSEDYPPSFTYRLLFIKLVFEYI